MFQKVVVSLACGLLLVAFNVDVSDAIRCYSCESYHNKYCGTYHFAGFGDDMATIECPEKSGSEAVCISRSTYPFWGPWLVRTCKYRTPGGNVCKKGESCEECRQNLCNNVRRLPWMKQDI